MWADFETTGGGQLVNILVLGRHGEVQSSHLICMQRVAKHFERLNRFKRNSKRGIRVYIKRKVFVFSSQALFPGAEAMRSSAGRELRRRGRQWAGDGRPTRGGAWNGRCRQRGPRRCALLSAGLTSVRARRGRLGSARAGERSESGLLPWLLGRHLRRPSCPARSFPSPLFRLAGSAGVQPGGSPIFSWRGGRWVFLFLSLGHPVRSLTLLSFSPLVRREAAAKPLSFASTALRLRSRAELLPRLRSSSPPALPAALPRLPRSRGPGLQRCSAHRPPAPSR